MILRLEQYLTRAAGDTTGAIPENPETNIEAYLAILAGENRQAPEPVTRLDMYLYNLIGGNYPIPAPNTRIEQYLAKACGLEIEVPTPITREEQLWYAIANPSWQITTLTGALPLSFKSKGEALTDYKIYGTADGAGVETENLFDYAAQNENNGYRNNAYLSKFNTLVSSNVWEVSEFLPLEPDTEYYLYWDIDTTTAVGAGFYDENKDIISNFAYSNRKGYSFVADDGRRFVRFSVSKVSEFRPLIGLYVQKDNLIYEPYGYKLPLTVESGEESTTTPIYIGDSKLMAEEYVDYESGKVYRDIGGVLTPTDPPVALPELSTYQGENTLSCSEELGEVSITGYIKEAGNG